MVLILGKKVGALLPPSLGPVIYVAVCVWPKYSILGLYVGTASGNKKTKYFKFQSLGLLFLFHNVLLYVSVNDKKLY
jgi:hypothetical protein